MTVDTLSLAKEQRLAELSSTQAEAIAAAIGHALSETAETSTDLDRFKAGLGRFDTLDQRLDALEQRLVARIEAARSSLLIWFVGVVVAVGGLVLAVFKL